jgi:hypothetical protein
MISTLFVDEPGNHFCIQKVPEVRLKKEVIFFNDKTLAIILSLLIDEYGSYLKKPLFSTIRYIKIPLGGYHIVRSDYLINRLPQTGMSCAVRGHGRDRYF